MYEDFVFCSSCLVLDVPVGPCVCEHPEALPRVLGQGGVVQASAAVQVTKGQHLGEVGGQISVELILQVCTITYVGTMRVRKLYRNKFT